MRSVRVVVRGRVQGVGFRTWVGREAGERGLKGWVRNRREGTVEAMLSGEDATVSQMLAALQQGPPGAAVTAVEVEASTEEGAAGFAVRPTV